MNNYGLGFMRHNLKNFEENKIFFNYAFNKGINYFETGLGYLNFQCEDYVYSLLKPYSRNSYTLCTKIPIQSYCDKNDFKTTYYNQIKKIPKNYFDIYMLQAINPIANYILIEQEILPFLLQEKEKGNIKRIGISLDCDSYTLETILPLIKWDIIQMPFNYFDWFLCDCKRTYEIICKNNIPIVAQAPLKGGMLVNHLNKQEKEFLFNEPFLASLKFVKNFNFEKILIGCTNIQHLNNYYNLKNISFKEEQYKKVIQSYKERTFTYCLGCNKCFLVCPSKIPIASFIRLYNKALYSKESFLNLMDLKYYYGEPIEHCKGCKKCEQVCPINLPIYNKLSKDIFYLRT